MKQRLVTPIFEQIHQQALASWQRPAAPAPEDDDENGGGGAAGTYREVPITLLSIGASADHAHTCPDLVAYLRQRVRRVLRNRGRSLSLTTSQICVDLP